MPRQKFGDLLRRYAPLTAHDIDEILQEQSSSRRRFGEVAIALGLCRPEHVWRAWSEQHTSQIEHIDLDAVGIDTQAVARLPREIAMRFGVVPVRIASGALILATSECRFEESSLKLPKLLETRIKFVIADESQIRSALSTYYST